MGRLGTWFGWQGTDVVPDVVCLAKALANGLPIGAIVARGDAAAAFQPGDHASTFGGGPVVCAAALAVLDVLEREGLIGRAATLGGQLSTLLGELGSSLVAGVRGRGLLQALVLTRPVAAAVAAAALERGLVVNAVAADAVRLAPPLVIGEDELRHAVRAADRRAGRGRGRGVTRSLLTLADLDPAGVHRLLDDADSLSERTRRDDLQGRTVGLVFEKPSTRTRVSFEVAVVDLGGHPLVLSSGDLQLGRGEPVADTARVLSSYLDALVVRTFDQSRLTDLATFGSIPVVNALSDQAHPCQALADLQTIRAHLGRLRGVRVAWLGDGNNVAASLARAAAMTGMQLVVAGPSGYGLPDDVVAECRRLATDGAVLTVTDDPVAAVDGAQVVATDVWTSMGDDPASSGVRRDVMAPYALSSELLSKADPDAVVLHCLPAHRGEEIAAEVIDGARSLVWRQAANRLPTAKAVLRHVLGEPGGLGGRGS